jgi:heme exporter protein D
VNGTSLADFLDMGGYGLYVWGSYAMVAVVLAWEGWMLMQRRRRAFDDISLQMLIDDIDLIED